ncbi:MAG TPA: hypothetical protein VFG39_01820 [Balneolaceae bacterium]|nr:hypothetical protein [Balneolaceae bacterium]
MKTFHQKFAILVLVLFGLMALPLKAQQVDEEGLEQAFIEQGAILTGFSVGFTNASDRSYDESVREISQLLINFDGLYFVSDHFGIGPMAGYEFVYRDLVATPPVSVPGDIDTRSWQFKFGAKAGWYTSANELFGWPSGNALFFVDAGVNWLRSRYQIENSFNPEADYDFGYQIGTGFLFPVGEQIAIETKLGFQSHAEDYRWGITSPAGTAAVLTETKWIEDVTLSVGFKVKL